MTQQTNSGLIQRLFPLDSYTDPIERRQAIGTYATSALFSILAVLLLIVDIAVLQKTEAADASATNRVSTVVILITSVLAILLTRQRQQNRGAIILITVINLYISGIAFAQILDLRLYLAISFTTMSLGALIIGAETIPFITGVIILTLIISMPRTTIVYQTLTLVISIIETIAQAGVSYLLANSLREVARQVAENINERRLQLAEASSRATQRLLMSRLDLDVLLRDSVQLVRDSLPEINEAQLYLIDKERKNAELVATTYKGSEVVVGSKIGVGSLSVIGRVTIGGQHILVRNAPDDQPYRKMAFLPDIASEIAIPMRVGDQTIGALDLQSKSLTAFTPNDIEALQVLANQVAIAIDNAQLYAEAQAHSAENGHLLEQARANLREIERLNQRLTGVAWSEYLRSSPNIPAYSIDLTTGQVEDVADWTPTLVEASRKNEVVVKAVGQHKTIALPISVRGQVIGAMEFEVQPDYDPGPEEMTILQQVIERLGLAAENARLFEEAQRIAQREAMVNEISTRMQAMNNVEAVIAAATQSLADTFKAPRVAIRLGTPEG